MNEINNWIILDKEIRLKVKCKICGYETYILEKRIKNRKVCVGCKKNNKDIQWANEIKKRDKSCWICNGKNLHAHHIESKTYYPKTRYDLDNGIALCEICHAMQHPEFGSIILNQVKNLKSKLEEWGKIN